MPTDEKHLVKLAQSGDIQAFGEIYDRFSPGVFNLACRMLGNRDDAEDATQEVFLKAHRALGEFRLSSKLSTWIYRIAANLCVDLARRRKPVVSADSLIADHSWEPADESQANDPQRELEAQATRKAVQEALAKMPEHYRILIVLRHIENLSYEETAAVVGCSVNALNVRLHRARQSFKAAIAPFLAQEDDAGELPDTTKKNIALL